MVPFATPRSGERGDPGLLPYQPKLNVIHEFSVGAFAR
jgi:hypothetical protein